MPLVKYSFVVKGHYEDGNRAKLSGHLIAEDGYPSSAFAAAIKVCQDTTPSTRLTVDLSKPGQVTLRKLKQKAYRASVAQPISA